MSCLNNQKQFLFWKFNGPHDDEVIRMGKFMLTAASDTFLVEFRCKRCGAKRIEHFVKWDELLAYGKTNEEIEAATKIEF